MTVFQAIVLGIIQGLTEFIPISSSGHLLLTPWLLGWPAPGLAFDVALHVGTIGAVLAYFRREWLRLSGAAWDIARTRSLATPERRRVVYLIVASIPAAIVGVLLEEHAETTFRAPVITASMLIVVGILLWAVDRVARRSRSMDDMRVRDALLLGLAQCVALIPGVSRSGATITAGLALSFDRRSAAAFSFLMSLPITAGAALIKVPEVIRDEGISAPFVAGILASAVSGWLAISVLLRFVSTHSYGVFAVYRVLLGLFVLGLLWFRV
jgi:undecaprenyl-diphosphatase